MSFQELIDDLEALHKALPSGNASADDKKIVANAGENAGKNDGKSANDDGDDDSSSGDNIGGNDDASGNVDGTGGSTADGKGNTEAGDGDMIKSFSIVLDDGTEVQAIDGEELMKSLSLQQDAMEQRLNTMQEKSDSTEKMISDVFAKSFQLVKTQTELLNKQDQMIKSLKADIDRLSNQGRGRASVVLSSQTQKTQQETPLAKSFGDFTPSEFLAKCLAAQRAGKISGQDAMMAETYINSGLEVPKHIFSRVIG